MNGLGSGAVRAPGSEQQHRRNYGRSRRHGRRGVNAHLLWRPVNRSRPVELMVDALARRP
eukprot:608273-Prymnesium_polylepis.1